MADLGDPMATPSICLCSSCLTEKNVDGRQSPMPVIISDEVSTVRPSKEVSDFENECKRSMVSSVGTPVCKETIPKLTAASSFSVSKSSSLWTNSKVSLR